MEISSGGVNSALVCISSDEASGPPAVLGIANECKACASVNRVVERLRFEEAVDWGRPLLPHILYTGGQNIFE